MFFSAKKNFFRSKRVVRELQQPLDYQLLGRAGGGQWPSSSSRASSSVCRPSACACIYPAACRPRERARSGLAHRRGENDGGMCAQVGWAWRFWPTTQTQSASKSRQRCRRRCSRYCARALCSAPRCLACVYEVERGELAAPPEAGGQTRLVTAQYRWQPHSGAKCPMRPRNVDETVQAIILATDPDEKDFRTLPNSL
jgi:hypothetical protein